MTTNILIERAKKIGLPITKNAFEGTLESPVPPMPYLVYLIPHHKARGADYYNNLKETSFDLELYTQEDNEEREELAKHIENEVFFDIEYECFLTPIESEDCYQTAYEVKGILEKKHRRKVNG